MKKILLLLTVYSQLLTTPLHKAIKQNDMLLLEQLLIAGADPNSVKMTGNRNTSTDFWGHSDIMQFNIKYPSLIHIAILNDNLTAVCILLKYHADPNAKLKYFNGRSQEQLSSLMLAILLNRIAIVELLLWHGVNTEEFTDKNLTAIYRALNFKNLETAQAIDRRVPLTIHSQDIFYRLRLSFIQKQLEV